MGGHRAIGSGFITFAPDMRGSGGRRQHLVGIGMVRHCETGRMGGMDRARHVPCRGRVSPHQRALGQRKKKCEREQHKPGPVDDPPKPDPFAPCSPHCHAHRLAPRTWLDHGGRDARQNSHDWS